MSRLGYQYGHTCFCNKCCAARAENLRRLRAGEPMLPTHNSKKEQDLSDLYDIPKHHDD